MRHRSPLFPPALARLHTYRIGALGTVLFGAGFAGWLVLAPTFLVEVWGFTIVESGFAIAPAPVAMAITAGPAGKICSRFGYRWVIAIGSLIALGGVLAMAMTVNATSSYVTSFLPGAILLGIGVGVGFPMLTAASMNDVPASKYAVGAAGNTTVRQVALALGISIAVAVVGTQDSATNDVSSFQQSWVICGVFFLATSVCIALGYPNQNHQDARLHPDSQPQPKPQFKRQRRGEQL